jgi:hypothetical protein
MKAHFRFIGNNKMKADFCFIESAKWCRAPRAVATYWSKRLVFRPSRIRSALRRIAQFCSEKFSDRRKDREKV